MSTASVSIDSISKLAIIVAGGSGSRMKSAIPKQFLPLAGSPVLFRTIRAFAAVPGMRVVLVLPEAQMSTWDELCHSESLGVDVEVAFGGKTRHESVSNGLALWRGESLVGVHDGVRPLVTPEFIKSVYAEAFKSGTAIPVLPSVESVRIVDANGGSHAVDRSTVMMVQTPQVFTSDILLDAYRQPYAPLFTDDASVVESNGVAVSLCAGLIGNIKLTTPEDMHSAEAIIEQRGHLHY